MPQSIGRSLSLLLVMLLLVALTVRAEDRSEPLRVVATTTVIADVARQIGGERVVVTSIMPPNSDVHAFQPTPRDLLPLANAEVVLVNGADLEETMIRTVYANAPVDPVVISYGIPVLAYGVDRGSGKLGLAPRRLLAADDRGSVHVFNVFSEEWIASFAIGDGEPVTLITLPAEHPRSAAAVTSAGVVAAIDSGFRMVEHFDHYDPYLVNPQIVDPPTDLPVHGVVVALDEVARAALGIVSAPVVHPNRAGEAIVLSSEGDMLVVDPRSGARRLSLTILPSGIDPTAAHLIRSGDKVYVALDTRLIEVYAGADELVLTDAWELDFSVRSLVAFGAFVDPHALDTTSQVTGRILGVGVDCAIQGDAIHGPCDAHFWLDPMNVIRWAENIADAFTAVDPAGADVYRANAEAYRAQLIALDAEIAETLSVIPLEDRQLVTNHDFLGYFARRYGFEIKAVVIPGGSTLIDPSLRAIAELVEIIEREGIRTLITEFSNANRVSDSIAADVGLRTIMLYSESLSDADGDAPTYLDYMRFNARALAEGLTAP